MLYKIINRLHQEHLWNKYQETPNYSRYNIRFCRDIRTPKCNLGYAKKWLSYLALKDWNEIPLSIKELPTLSQKQKTFKNAFDELKFYSNLYLLTQEANSILLLYYLTYFNVVRGLSWKKVKMTWNDKGLNGGFSHSNWASMPLIDTPGFPLWGYLINLHNTFVCITDSTANFLWLATPLIWTTAVVQISGVP